MSVSKVTGIIEFRGIYWKLLSIPWMSWCKVRESSGDFQLMNIRMSELLIFSWWALGCQNSCTLFSFSSDKCCPGFRTLVLICLVLFCTKHIASFLLAFCLVLLSIVQEEGTLRLWLGVTFLLQPLSLLLSSLSCLSVYFVLLQCQKLSGSWTRDTLSMPSLGHGYPSAYHRYLSVLFTYG